MDRAPLHNGATLVSFVPGKADCRKVALAQNFSVEWVETPGGRVAVESGAEFILILSQGAAIVADNAGETTISGSTATIVPAGALQATLAVGGPLLILATHRRDLDQTGAAVFSRGQDARIAGIGEPFRRNRPLDRPLVMPFDEIANPSGNPRVRFFQSATMSVNLVRYRGARDTSALSPHAHNDIEQGSLAVLGHYVHHLRTAWVPDKSKWRDDAHIDAGPGTLLLIPPELVHTTEGVGEDEHLLLDIFAPPRRDFIAKGFVANADDYTDPGVATRRV